ncbi:MAG: capsule assembly Wzi family protein [Candidatus Poribacteria bacterium]
MKIKQRALIFTLLFTGIILFPKLIFASPISMPLDHWSYHFIERFQAKGVLKDYLNNTKPYSRDDMAKMVFYISNEYEKGNLKLTKIEKGQLNDLKEEFSQELNKLGMTDIKGKKHLIDWSKDTRNGTVQMSYIQDIAIKRGTEDHNVYKGTYQVLVKGNFDDSFFFNIDGRASYEKSDESRPIWIPYYTRYPWEAIADSYIVLRLPWTDVQFGKDQVLWGTGYNGVIGLAGVNRTFDIIKFPIEFWRIKYTNILGFPRDELIENGYTKAVTKYLAAHRFEAKVIQGLVVSWQEAYVFAKGFHIQLLNPITPYQMLEDYLGDVGNNTMEGDIDICLIPNVKFYSALFLDDYHVGKNPLTYGAFRWAGLGGLLITDPFGIDDTDFRAEYARVEPWVYPHKGIIEKPPSASSYKQFDLPLGHWIGPNADNLFFEVNKYLTKNFQTAISYSKIRKGEIGGSIYDYDPKAMDSEKKFLDGIVEKTQSVNLSVIYRWMQDSNVKISYSIVKIDNKQTEKAKLPSALSDKEPWKAGNNWSQNILNVSLTFKY